jgi:ATP-binding protein involved in chromosome partitioning
LDIKNYLLVVGKGGVGKTTLSILLALRWLEKGKKVGILDANFSSPDIPLYLGIPPLGVETFKEDLEPLEIQGLKVLSLGLFLEQRWTPVSWRGPIRHRVLEHFLNKVQWGELDVLLIDMPPGIGEEHLTLGELLKGKAQVLFVSDSSRGAVFEVKRLNAFFRQLGIKPLGVALNKESWHRPRGLKLKLLGAIPFESELLLSSKEEGGLLYFEGGKTFRTSLKRLANRTFRMLSREAGYPLTLKAKILLKGG